MQKKVSTSILTWNSPIYHHRENTADMMQAALDATTGSVNSLHALSFFTLFIFAGVLPQPLPPQSFNVASNATVEQITDMAASTP